ncbi:uncharacterized protein [Oryza sativa Japonica Group]|jgi:hypothetical protein|uniref:Os06g0167800 protein n=3 Tax=Oryza sativa TaxID=4530 RepID=Q5WAA9_ORYSJ|nr:uncharacterized protein LOC107277937 [Oryza sativa Japonica Group]EEC80091.1 hypothetical protein OsI_21828 [Oryza sativa Indica Group]EAZ35961.1 hypothetical protein OsJ_20264 [Oryza sativa Japonica Group]KAF2925393.1 hypothetical protein DAI22_06g048700 [Oryza sativa Japonica Group]BAD67611.1 hypothetical protein [Oryza sativa Japonica Group]BAD67963.1 hypothetical protein [Oryza sativa Japonica Group]
MADRVIHYLLRGNQLQGRRQTLAVGVGHHHRRRLLLLDSSRVFMLLAVVILVHLLTAGAAAVQGAEPCVLVAAFLLWLLGAAFAVLSLAAGQFPVLAATAATIATTLRSYLIGGL